MRVLISMSDICREGTAIETLPISINTRNEISNKIMELKGGE